MVTRAGQVTHPYVILSELSSRAKRGTFCADRIASKAIMTVHRVPRFARDDKKLVCDDAYTTSSRTLRTSVSFPAVPTQSSPLPR